MRARHSPGTKPMQLLEREQYLADLATCRTHMPALAVFKEAR